MVFEFENDNDKLTQNLKIPLKYRLQWLENALEFNKKLPSDIKKKQEYIRNTCNNWNNKFEKSCGD